MRFISTLTVLCILLSTSAYAAEKPGRDLLIVTNLVTHGKREFAWLYRFLNASSVSMAQTALKGKYRKIHVLGGVHATKERFTGSMIRISEDPQLQALDVFLNVHGKPEQLTFEDGRRSMASIREELTQRSVSKLRLLYSTTCYGASHADDFVSAGFRIANGSRGVNSNGSYEYPVILAKWSNGRTFGEAQKAGNNRAMIRIHDSAARAVGFNDVDSFKLVFGDAATTIHTGIR